MASALVTRAGKLRDPAAVRLAVVRRVLSLALRVAQAPCSTNCTVYADHMTPSIHGQQMKDTGNDGTRTYAYDAAGRITSSTDTPTGGTCTTKKYDYDADGDRLHRKTYPASSGGACSTTTTPSTQTLSYDEADRLTNTGYAYDTLGRITTVPATDAGGTNALTAGYYVDDRAHTLTQASNTTTLDLDPDSRVRQRTVGSGTPTVSHYGDGSDNPRWTVQGSTMIRNSTDVMGDLVASLVVGTSSPKLELTDLHGDVVSEIPNSSGATSTLLPATDEFGMPTATAGVNAGYGYLGANQRNTALATGTIEMGARLYQPQIGRFLQVDPIFGGSANPYDYALQDPLNTFDLDGRTAINPCGYAARKQVGAKRANEICRAMGGHPIPKPDPVKPVSRGTKLCRMIYLATIPGGVAGMLGKQILKHVSARIAAALGLAGNTYCLS